MGVLNLLFQLFAFFLILTPSSFQLNQVSQQTSDRIALIVYSVIGIAIGLLCLRKWAVIYFCLASVLAAVWLFFNAIWFVPFPFNLFYMVLAVVFVLPTIIFIRSWSLLSWGVRWFS